jgi:hypothetical protein
MKQVFMILIEASHTRLCFISQVKNQKNNIREYRMSKFLKLSTITLSTFFLYNSDLLAKGCEGWLKFDDFKSVERILDQGYTKENDGKFYDAEGTKSDEEKLLKLLSAQKIDLTAISLEPRTLSEKDDHKCSYELIIDGKDVSSIDVARYDSEPKQVADHKPSGQLILDVLKNSFKQVPNLIKHLPGLANAFVKKTPVLIKEGSETVFAVIKLVNSIQTKKNDEIANDIKDIIKNMSEFTQESVELFEDGLDLNNKIDIKPIIKNSQEVIEAIVETTKNPGKIGNVFKEGMDVINDGVDLSSKIIKAVEELKISNNENTENKN